MSGEVSAKALWRRWRVWWHEPHFLAKTRAIGIALLALVAVLVPPSAPVHALAMLVGVALLWALPHAPRVVPPVGLALCLVEMWVLAGAGERYEPDELGVVIVLFCLFLGSGYVYRRWFARVGVVVGYALAETASGVWLGADSPALSGIRGIVDGTMAALWAQNHPSAQGPGLGLSGEAAAAAASMPGPGPVVYFVGGVAVSCILSGMSVAMGHAFAETHSANARRERSEAMVGRLTREQELAHMIHDSVANDASVIAMLAWQAKMVDDDREMLDMIYQCAHHALDRTHEVIDVLNGAKDLGDTAGAEVGETTDASSVSLERYCEDRDRMMHMLGFEGHAKVRLDDPVASVQGENGRLLEPIRRCTLGLLEEIYANIVRHGDSDGGPYAVVVSTDSGGLRVTATNPLAVASDGLQAFGRMRHGRGLALHRAEVEALGGELNAAAEDGVWVLNAHIPLR